MEKGKIKEFKIPISLLIIAITLFFMILFPLYWFNLVILSDQFNSFISFIGYWSYYIFGASIIIFLYFSYVLYVNIKDRRKFEELMHTDSKNAFVKNIKDLEIISRRLGPKFVKKYNEKKEELKIKL